MTSLVDKIVAVSTALDEHGIPHALGGALALAWCTGQARGTIDIDVNLFVDPSQVQATLGALPATVAWSAADARAVQRDGQARLWWDRTPIDVFFDTTAFHRAVSGRVVRHELGGQSLPFLACSDLAVFKAFFDRTKDWADLEEMLSAGSLDVSAVTTVLGEYLGPDDARIARLLDIAARFGT